MHSIQLKIDDSIFEKVMTMLEMLPQDKIKVEEDVVMLVLKYRAEGE